MHAARVSRSILSRIPRKMSTSTKLSDSFTTPDGKEVDVSDLAAIYKSSIRYPVPHGAQVHSRQDDSWSVSLHSSIANPELMKTDHIEEQVLLVERNSDLTIRYLSQPFFNSQTLLQDCVLSTRVILTQGSGPRDYTITWLEDGILQRSFKLSERKEHGALLMAPLFSRFKLSPDASHLMYVAEKKQAHSESFFSHLTKPQVGDDLLVGDKYLFREDWGEGYTGIHSSVICILNLKDNSVHLVSMDRTTLVEPFWITSDEIGFIGIEEEPRRLNFIFSFNRPTRLYTCTVKGPNVSSPVCRLGDSQKVSLRSPRMSPDVSRVVLLENPVLGPDFTSCKIVVYDFRADSKKVVVTNEASLYVHSLPEECWNVDGTMIYFNSLHKCRSLLWQLDVDKCSLKRVRSPFASATFLTANHGLAIIKSSSITDMPQLFACVLDDTRLEASSWTPLSRARQRNHISYKIIEIKQKLHAILISPSDISEKPGACIVIPHGGPHGASIDEYSPSHDRFVKLGFKVLLVNYCGSVGYDDKTLSKLIGHVGEYDVEDCMSAISHLKEKKLIDKAQLFLMGGSWGGFITCHMAARHPEAHWVALATKAPVTDLTSLAFNSDSPDFCWNIVLGSDYSPKDNPIQPGVLSKMFDASPIRWVPQMETPCIVFAGSQDRCVPMTQSKAWHSALKDRGVATRFHTYEDGHTLRKLHVDSDIFVNSVVWFLTHNKLRAHLPK